MKTYCLELTGDFACFTRPEMKVERVSYDVMTPSAARACFESIIWKPAIKWHIFKIEVLKPIKWSNIRRNEVKSVVSCSKAKSAMKTGEIFGLDVESDRTQRASLLLRDVGYRIHATLQFFKELDSNSIYAKYQEMFIRRASKGQCINQPYLGCREFSSSFRYISDPSAEPPPIVETRDLGFMLHDMDYKDPENITPRFFRAQMTNGVIDVPAWDSEDIRE